MYINDIVFAAALSVNELFQLLSNDDMYKI